MARSPLITRGGGASALPTRAGRRPVQIGGAGGGPREVGEEELPFLSRERKAIQGIVSGIFKGAIELGKDVFSGRFDLVRKIPGETVRSFGRTVKGENMRKAIAGDTTFSEALVEDLSNVALVGGATSLTLRKAAKTAKAAGKADRATKLLSAADKAHTVAAPLHTMFRGARRGARTAVIKRLEDAADAGLGTSEAGRILQSPLAKFALKQDVREPLRQTAVKADTTASQFTHEVRRAADAMDLPGDATIGADLATDTARRMGIELPFERVAGRGGVPRPAATATFERLGNQMFNRLKTKRKAGELPDDATDLDLSIDAYGRVVQGTVSRQAVSQMWDTMSQQGFLRSWTRDVAPAGWKFIDPTDVSGRLPFQRGTVVGRELDQLLGEPAVPRHLIPDDPNARFIVPDGMNSEFQSWIRQQDINGPIVQAMDKPLNAFRAAVLFHSPRWLLNNLAGNLMLSTLTGATLDPKAWRFAWEQARKDFRDVPALVTGRGVQREFATAAREAGRGFVGRNLVGNPLARAFRNANEFTDRFARTMVYRRELRRRSGEVGDFDVDAMLNKVREGRELSETERALRDRAGNAAREALVDYGRLTPFEKSVMRRIFPFYTWQSGILKLTLSMPADHPLRFALLEELSNNFGGFSQEERQEGLPEYLFGSIPVGEEGEAGRLLTRGLNPFQDAFSLTTKDGLRSSVNPVIDMIASSLGFPGEFERPFRPLGIGGAGQTLPGVSPQQLLGGTFESFLPQARLISELGAPILPEREQLGLPPTRGLQSEVMLGLGINIHSPERIANAQEREMRARGTQQTRAARLTGEPSGRGQGFRLRQNRSQLLSPRGGPILPTRR